MMKSKNQKSEIYKIDLYYNDESKSSAKIRVEQFADALMIARGWMMVAVEGEHVEIWWKGCLMQIYVK